MAHKAEIKSLLSTLESNCQALKEAEDDSDPKLENLVSKVKDVKRNLEETKIEIIKYNHF